MPKFELSRWVARSAFEIETRLAVDGAVEAVEQRDVRIVLLAGIVRNLEPAEEAAEDEAHLAGRIDDLLGIGEAMLLIGVVMHRVVIGRRRVDAVGAVEEIARGEIIPAGDMAAIFGARLRRPIAAAIHLGRAAVLEHAALGRDVDDARGPETVFRRHRAGDEVHRLDEARAEALAEKAHAVGNDDAVDAILDVEMLVADMDGAVGEIVLGDARRLQQHLVEAGVLACGWPRWSAARNYRSTRRRSARCSAAPH